MTLGFDTADAELARAASSRPDPEEFLRRELVRALFAKSVDRLNSELSGSGREQQYRLFELFNLGQESSNASTDSL